MGRVEEMATEKATILLNRRLKPSCLEGSIEQRLGEVDACVKKLEDYRGEISDELDRAKTDQKYSSVLSTTSSGPEHKFEITERLLSLYVGVSEGGIDLFSAAARPAKRQSFCA